MERLTQEEIFQRENKLIAGRIQEIAEGVERDHNSTECFESSLLFFNKDGAAAPAKGLAWIRVYLEKPSEPGFEFDLPDDFDYPVYSLSLRHEDFGGDFIPSDATIMDHARIMWTDRGHNLCEPGQTYLFTPAGRSLLINHAYEDEFPMNEYEIPHYEVTYRVDLDTLTREFSSRELELGDYEKVGLVLHLIESGQFYPSPLPTWIQS